MGPGWDQLATLPAMLRLQAAHEMGASGSLQGMDAVLGAPLAMPELAAVAEEDAFRSLPLAERGRVVGALFFALVGRPRCGSDSDSDS